MPQSYLQPFLFLEKHETCSKFFSSAVPELVSYPKGFSLEAQGFSVAETDCIVDSLKIMEQKWDNLTPAQKADVKRAVKRRFSCPQSKYSLGELLAHFGPDVDYFLRAAGAHYDGELWTLNPNPYSVKLKPALNPYTLN